MCTILRNINNDRMADRKDTTLRRPPFPYWFYRGLPGSYPIFHPFVPGRAGDLCAERPTLLHTLGERRALCASCSLTIPGLEPRALLATHGAHRTPWSWYTEVQCTPWYTRGGIGRYSTPSMVYPGGIGRYSTPTMLPGRYGRYSTPIMLPGGV